MSHFTQTKYPNYYVNADGVVKRVLPDGRTVYYDWDRSDSKYRVIYIRQPEGGYARVYVHYLVLSTFLPAGQNRGYVIDHIDGNKSNNALSNLRWCTPAQNTQYSVSGNYTARYANLTHNAEDVRKIKELCYNATVNKSELAKMYNMSISTLSNIIYGHRWADVAPEFTLTRKHRAK